GCLNIAVFPLAHVRLPPCGRRRRAELILKIQDLKMATLTNLLDFDPAQLVAYCAELGEKPFRAKQLQRWIHQFGVANFDDMTDLAKSLREKLKTRAEVR